MTLIIPEIPSRLRFARCTSHSEFSFKAFSNAEFRTVLIEQFGAEPQEATPAHVGYELRKLRGKGLIRKSGTATAILSPISGTGRRCI